MSNQKPPDKGKPKARWFQWKFYQIFKRISTNSQTLPNKLERILPNSSWEASITLILKSAKDAARKENQRPIFLRNTDTKILNKLLAGQTRQHMKRIIHHDQVGFTPEMKEWSNIWKPISVIHTTLTEWKPKIRWSSQLMQKKLLIKFNKKPPINSE